MELDCSWNFKYSVYSMISCYVRSMMINLTQENAYSVENSCLFK